MCHRGERRAAAARARPPRPSVIGRVAAAVGVERSSAAAVCHDGVARDWLRPLRKHVLAGWAHLSGTLTL